MIFKNTKFGFELLISKIRQRKVEQKKSRSGSFYRSDLFTQLKSGNGFPA